MRVSMEIWIILIDSKWTLTRIKKKKKHVATEENLSITRSHSGKRELIDDLNLSGAPRGAVRKEPAVISALCSTCLRRVHGSGSHPSNPTMRWAAPCWGGSDERRWFTPPGCRRRHPPQGPSCQSAVLYRDRSASLVSPRRKTRPRSACSASERLAKHARPL